MARQRIEDLGRLSVLLDDILDHAIFAEDRMDSENFPEWFSNQTDAKQDEVLSRFARGIDDLEERISLALEIAQGVDRLNNSHDP